MVDLVSGTRSCMLSQGALPSTGPTSSGTSLWSRVCPSACFLPSSCPQSRSAVEGQQESFAALKFSPFLVLSGTSMMSA